MLKAAYPIRGYRVAIYKLDDEGGMSSDKGFPIDGVTNTEGKVRFRVDQILKANNKAEAPLDSRRPLTVHHDAAVIVLEPIYHCSDTRLSLHEIIASGTVGKITSPRCDRKFDTAKFHASPGELIMFVQKMGWRGG